jgi:hypothetical protein
MIDEITFENHVMYSLKNIAVFYYYRTYAQPSQRVESHRDEPREIRSSESSNVSRVLEKNPDLYFYY